MVTVAQDRESSVVFGMSARPRQWGGPSRAIPYGSVLKSISDLPDLSRLSRA